MADQELLGGKGQELRNKIDSLNPATRLGDKALGKVIGAVSGGKNAAQQGRDQVRGLLQKSGLTNEKHEITLSDGTIANLGIDGHGEQHSFTDAKSVGAKDRKLSSYDVDYSNDLDFASAMGGMTLSRLLSGGSAKNVDQIGGQIGNAALKGVGYNKGMTEENYNKVMKEQRGMYSRVGIKSKDDALQLANQAFAEGRMDEIQHTSALQSINMIFDNNSYGQATKLMAGRNQGAQAANKTPAKASPEKGSTNAFISNLPSGLSGRTPNIDTSAGAPTPVPRPINSNGTALAKPRGIARPTFNNRAASVQSINSRAG